MDNSIVSDLIRMFDLNILKESISFNGSEFICQIDKLNFEADKKILEKVFDDVEILPDNKISFKLRNVKISNLKVYYRKDHFLKSKGYLDDFNDLTIIVLDNKSLIKKQNESYSNENSIIFNNYAYQNILKLLNQSENFTSLGNNNNEFTLISKENGLMHIGYKNIEPRLEELEDLLPIYKLLKNRFERTDLSGTKSENIEFIKLFIENISTAGFGNDKLKKDDSFFEILRAMKIIISLTERDYDNYINNFSFEKIKAKFRDERNKYFEGLEKNVELISKQVVSFPLTFAATAFASYQVKDKHLILFLVFIAYLLYTIIAFKILKITSYNIECLEKDINKEEEAVKKNYNKKHIDFAEDFEKIRSKTIKIKSLICYLKAILVSMLILFLVFIFFQINSENGKEVKRDIIKIPIVKTIDTIRKAK